MLVDDCARGAAEGIQRPAAASPRGAKLWAGSCTCDPLKTDLSGLLLVRFRPVALGGLVGLAVGQNPDHRSLKHRPVGRPYGKYQTNWNIRRLVTGQQLNQIAGTTGGEK